MTSPVGGSIWNRAQANDRLDRMTSSTLRRKLRRLATTERLELVEGLWDSIPEEDEAIGLTVEQRDD